MLCMGWCVVVWKHRGAVAIGEIGGPKIAVVMPKQKVSIKRDMWPRGSIMHMSAQ